MNLLTKIWKTTCDTSVRLNARYIAHKRNEQTKVGIFMGMR